MKFKKTKILLASLSLCLAFGASTTLADSHNHAKIDSHNVGVREVVNCPDHGRQHIPARSLFVKYMHTNGNIYNASKYTCSCGAEIFQTDPVNGTTYIFYGGTIKKYGNAISGFSYFDPYALYPQSADNTWSLYY